LDYEYSPIEGIMGFLPSLGKSHSAICLVPHRIDPFNVFDRWRNFTPGATSFHVIV
jgi:hypothetical protein